MIEQRLSNKNNSCPQSKRPAEEALHPYLADSPEIDQRRRMPGSVADKMI